MVVDAVSNEKGVEKAVIFEAIEAALASATRKRSRRGHRRARLDQPQRAATTTRGGAGRCSRTIPRELEDPAQRAAARRRARTSIRRPKIGGYVEEPMESVEFGRIAAQTAKQVIVQKVREAEREQVVEEFKARAGRRSSAASSSASIATACIVDLGGNAEGFIAREQMIPREPIRPQDRVKSLSRARCAPSSAVRSCSSRARAPNS